MTTAMKISEQQQELALGEEVGLAGFVDQFGNFEHGAMHGQIFQAAVDGQAEDQPEDAEENAEEQQLVAVDAEKVDLGEVGELEIGFAAGFLSGLGKCLRGGETATAWRATLSAEIWRFDMPVTRHLLARCAWTLLREQNYIVGKLRIAIVERAQKPDATLTSYLNTPSENGNKCDQTAAEPTRQGALGGPWVLNDATAHKVLFYNI